MTTSHDLSDDVRQYALTEADLGIALGMMMSSVSERCWLATWMTNMENDLPVILQRIVDQQQSERWGIDYISVAEAQTLLRMANALGFWVRPTYDMHGKPYRRNR